MLVWQAVFEISFSQIKISLFPAVYLFSQELLSHKHVLLSHAQWYLVCKGFFKKMGLSFLLLSLLFFAFIKIVYYPAQT